MLLLVECLDAPLDLKTNMVRLRCVVTAFLLRTVWFLKPFNETENICGMLTVLQLYIPVFRIGFKFSVANHNIHFYDCNLWVIRLFNVSGYNQHSRNSLTALFSCTVSVYLLKVLPHKLQNFTTDSKLNLDAFNFHA